MLDPVTFVRVAGLAGASQYVVERDRRRFKYPGRRSVVIYNGVDVNRFTPLPGARPHQPPVLVAVANLIREKGLDVLLEACRSLQELPWILRIVGDGPEEPALRQQATAGGIAGRVEFLGLRDDVERVLQEADIYVHPAVWEEAFGLTIAEAMASGCATLATRTGGIPEIVEDGVSGLLVPPGDAAALAAAIRRLLEDPPLRARLSAAGRQRIAEQFTLEASVRGQLDWIERAGTQRQAALPASAR
jgi:glycosyltransferase involved in cell wall biosynthesis